MRTIEEMESQLRSKRRARGWYGMRRDYAMERQLKHECYELYVEIERLRTFLQ